MPPYKQVLITYVYELGQTVYICLLHTPRFLEQKYGIRYKVERERQCFYLHALAACTCVRLLRHIVRKNEEKKRRIICVLITYIAHGIHHVFVVLHLKIKIFIEIITINFSFCYFGNNLIHYFRIVAKDRNKARQN